MTKSVLSLTPQVTKENEKEKDKKNELSKSKKEKKAARKDSVQAAASPPPTSAVVALDLTASSMVAVPHTPPSDRREKKEKKEKKERDSTTGSALNATLPLAASSTGPERRRTEKPGKVSTPPATPATGEPTKKEKRLSLQLSNSAPLTPPLAASTNPARSPRHTMKLPLTQENANLIKAYRLQALDASGIEVGSFAGGSPLILAGTLPKIVEHLSTWIVSHSLDAQSALQIRGFLMTYECFVSPEKLLQTIFDLYASALDMSLPESSREKFAKRKRAGLLKFLHTWLSDRSLSPHHRSFLKEPSFSSSIKSFVAQLSPDERESGAIAELCLFLASPDHKPTPRSEAFRLLPEEELSKIPPKGPGLAGLFGKKIHSVNDFEFLELNPRAVADQLTLIDYDRFLDLDPYDLVYLTWAKSTVSPDNFICQLAEKSKRLTRWIASEIISTSNASKRVEVMCRVIAIVEQLYLANNFQSMMNVLSGLNHGAVLRLNKTWSKLSPSTKKSYDKMTSIMAQFSAYKLYRRKLQKRMEGGEPVVPCIDVILRDVTLADENPRFVDDGKKYINFDKCMWYVNYLEALKPARVVRYYIDPRDETLADRLLRKFLSNPSPTFTDEELYNMSLKIEPRAKAQL